MTIPENFSDTKHLKTTLMQTYNQFVKDAFKDLDIDDLNLDINVPRQSLLKGCKITSTDSQILINNRMMLFYFVTRAAQDLSHPVYGMPVGTYHEMRRFKPQVFLYFKEDEEDVDPDYQPLRALISFRLMNDTELTVSNAELTTLANKVKSEFGTNNGYRWHKGKLLCTYIEPDRGYGLKIFAYTSSDAKEVINKVLDLQNHSPDWKYFNVSENDDASSAYPTIPPTKTILSKSTKLPRKRPVGYVRFQRATVHLWGLTKPVSLYDRTGIRYDSLVD
jgi:hypothetical protein